jgi:hypothetical protein
MQNEGSGLVPRMSLCLDIILQCGLVHPLILVGIIIGNLMVLLYSGNYFVHDAEDYTGRVLPKEFLMPVLLERLYVQWIVNEEYLLKRIWRSDALPKLYESLKDYLSFDTVPNE